MRTAYARNKALVLAFTLLATVLASAAAVERLPGRLSDASFWQMISTFSEQGGAFPYDNFVSNETLFQ